MIPIKDLNPRRTIPVVTLSLIAVNLAFLCYELSLGPSVWQFVITFGMVPARLGLYVEGGKVTLLAAVLPLFTSMFLHAGWLHLIGNMWYLWIFGPSVEDEMGHVPYLMFYFICGLGSGIAQTMFSWSSNLPGIGASGAIAGVLGAYFLLFPRGRVLLLSPMFIAATRFELPAAIFIGLWFLWQFWSASRSMQLGVTGGIAWWAHVGGFVLGMLLTKLIWRRGQAWLSAD
jgi:rhomboid family protein